MKKSKEVEPTTCEHDWRLPYQDLPDWISSSRSINNKFLMIKSQKLPLIKIWVSKSGVPITGEYSLTTLEILDETVDWSRVCRKCGKIYLETDPDGHKIHSFLQT